MVKAIYTVAGGTWGLIVAGVMDARNVMAASEPISDSSGVTIGLVIVALGAVGTGAWRLAMWVANESAHSRRQDERIAELEAALKKKSDK